MNQGCVILTKKGILIFPGILSIRTMRGYFAACVIVLISERLLWTDDFIFCAQSTAAIEMNRLQSVYGHF